MRTPIALIPAYALALIAAASPAYAADPTPQELAWAQMTGQAIGAGTQGTSPPPPTPPPPPPPTSGGGSTTTYPSVEYDSSPNY